MGEAVHQNRRRLDRTPTDIGLTCRVPARPSRARILDLSNYGCRIAIASNDAMKGSSIVLELPNGDRMDGLVVWVRGKEAGVRFAHRLRPNTAIALGLEVEVREEAKALLEPEVAQAQKLPHWFRKITNLFG